MATLRPHRLVVAVTSAALVLGGCSQGSAPQSEEAQRQPTPTPTATEAPTLREPPRPAAPQARGLQRFYDQGVAWKPCTGGFECGEVRVPLDYDSPAGETLSLAVSRRPGSSAGRRDTASDRVSPAGLS